MKIKNVLQLGALVLALSASSGCVQHKSFRREVDLNHDTIPDVVELRDTAVYVRLCLMREAKGKPLYAKEKRMSQEYFKVADMEIKDVNGDGNLDLIYFVKDSTQPFSRIRYGKGDGTFSVDVLNQH